MADIDSKLQIIIELLKKGQGDKQAREGLEKLDKQQGKTRASLTALAAAYRTFAASVLGVMVTRYVAQSIRAFEQQEQAVAKLNGTLRASKQFTEEYSQALQKQASEFQRVTRFGDEVVISVQQQLVAFGAAREDMEILTEATLDLSEGMGVDVVAAAQLMGKALAGEFGSMSEYGIHVDRNVSSTEKLKQAIEQVQNRFGGLARASASTRTGELEQMRNAFGDLREEVGKLALELVEVAGGINKVTKAVAGMTDGIKILRNWPGGGEARLAEILGTGVGQEIRNIFGLPPRGISGNYDNSDGEEKGPSRQSQLESMRIAFDRRAVPMGAQARELIEVNMALDGINATLAEREDILGRLAAAHEVERKALEGSLDQGRRMVEFGKDAFSQGLSHAIIDFTSGVKSASESFSEFGRNFLTTISDMILQTVIFSSVSRALGAFGIGGSAAAASGGMMPSKFAMGGVAKLSRATYFPKFNAVAGEAGEEFMTVLRNPKMYSLGGMPAAVGRIGNNQLALVNFQQAKTRFMANGGVAGELPRQFGALANGGSGGGVIHLMISHSRESEVRIIENSVQQAEVRVTKRMSEDSDLSRATKRVVQ